MRRSSPGTKGVGDAVSRDENLVDLETDKVVLEVPAPAGGVLKEIKVEDGATVTAGEILAVLAEGDGPVKEAAAPAEGARARRGGRSLRAPPKAVKTSPAVRRLLDEHDLDATMVTGTGKDGRVTKADVMAFLKADHSGNVTPGDPAPDLGHEDAVVALERKEQRVPMTRLRARIAERMVEAQHTAAMLTTFNEVDLTEVMACASATRNHSRNSTESAWASCRFSRKQPSKR